MKKYIYQFIHFSFLVIFLFVNFVILFNHVKINVTLSFFFNNNILILFGGLILIILIFLLQKMKIKLSDKSLLIILSLILFEILFEARSRYLFIYVPYFIILAILAINKIMLKLGMEE